MSGCREEAPAPFSPRFLPHDGGVDASEFDPPNTGASTNAGGSSVGSGAPTVSEEGCVGNFSDNFNDGINEAVWTRDADCNASVAADSERVRMVRSLGCGYSESYLLLKAGTFLCGDFDVTVEYRMPDWNPLEEGVRWTTLRAETPAMFFGDGSGIALERLGGQMVNDDCRDDADAYMAWTDSPSACLAMERDALRITSAITGHLRVGRTGAKVAAYIRGGMGWTKLLEVEGATGPMRLGLVMGSTGAEHLVFFDNITVQSQR